MIRVQRKGADARKAIGGAGAVETLVDTGCTEGAVAKESIGAGLHAS